MLIALWVKKSNEYHSQDEDVPLKACLCPTKLILRHT